MSVELVLEPEQIRLAPGDELRGNVRVRSGGNARSITVSLALVEVTADFRHAVTGAAQSRPLHTGPVETGAVLPFALRLPRDAPPGHRSTHGRLVWVVAAVCDQWGRDARAARELEVVPREAPDRGPWGDTDSPESFGGA
jgi:hypothetical protein